MPHIHPDTLMSNCAACHCELVGGQSEHPVVGRKVVAGHRPVRLAGGGTHLEPLCSRCLKLEKTTPNVGGRSHG